MWIVGHCGTWENSLWMLRRCNSLKSWWVLQVFGTEMKKGSELRRPCYSKLVVTMANAVDDALFTLPPQWRLRDSNRITTRASKGAKGPKGAPCDTPQWFQHVVLDCQYGKDRPVVKMLGSAAMRFLASCGRGCIRAEYWFGNEFWLKVQRRNTCRSHLRMHTRSRRPL